VRAVIDLPQAEPLKFSHSSGAKLGAMISKRQLAAVLLIAIVTIAIQLLPSIALAHGGHIHLRDSITAVTDDRAGGSAHQLNAEHSGAVARAKAADISRTAISGTCNHGCCASGFSCCVPAVLPEPMLRLPEHLKALTIERPGQSIRAGIDPEALPKPPKSFT
jgi:hypothetical protein